MRAAEIIDRTNSLYNIFKHTIRLNEHRFEDMDIDTVADILITAAGINHSTISRPQLIKHIRLYCEWAKENNIDTGIYY